jgi:hypothetical protein
MTMNMNMKIIGRERGLRRSVAPSVIGKRHGSKILEISSLMKNFSPGESIDNPA